MDLQDERKGMTLFTTTLALLWFISGAWSFIHWWTKDDDLTYSLIPLVIYASLIGPIGYVLGCALHGELTNNQSRIMIRRKLNPNQRKKIRMIIKDSNKGESNE